MFGPADALNSHLRVWLTCAGRDDCICEEEECGILTWEVQVQGGLRPGRPLGSTHWGLLWQKECKHTCHGRNIISVDIMAYRVQAYMSWRKEYKRTCHGRKDVSARCHGSKSVGIDAMAERM